MDTFVNQTIGHGLADAGGGADDEGTFVRKCHCVITFNGLTGGFFGDGMPIVTSEFEVKKGRLSSIGEPMT